MRMSRIFGETLRRPPADADLPGLQLLMRAAYIRSVAPGIFAYLPLGLRTLHKIEAIVRSEMEAIGGQEVILPLFQPAKLLERGGRQKHGGEEQISCEDRGARRLSIATSHEETAAWLAKSEITSYRQLPRLLYQIGTVFRDESRPRGGLLRAREFTLMDSYSFDRNEAARESQYSRHLDAFARIFRRVGLEDVVTAASGGGATAADLEHEFLFLGGLGDDLVALCDSCGHAASGDAADFAKPAPPEEVARPLEKVATPGTDTIESLARYLEIPAERTAKVVFFFDRDNERVVLALVRGDMEVSEAKLARAVGARRLDPAEAEIIRKTGAEPGYASPIGLDSQDLVIVVADPLVARSANLVSGANQQGYHYRNVNFERDYSADIVADIAAVFDGAPCPACQEPLRLKTGVELGSLHTFNPEYTSELEATFQDADGTLRPLAMGSYGIGIDRLLGCIAEQHHDDRGLCWPIAVAPYPVHLVAITRGEEKNVKRVDSLYYDLQQAGIEVLYDDRDASVGVKFNDADLIGAPLRLTFGPKTLERGGIEIKRRDTDVADILAEGAVLEAVRALLAELARQRH
jgi:prolyl-tRNA synthetase